MESSPKNVNEIKPSTERWAVHEARMGKIRNVYRILVRQSGRNAYCRCRLEDNIKINVIYIYIYIYHCWGAFIQVQFFMFRKTSDKNVINSYHLCFPKHKVSNLVTG